MNIEKFTDEYIAATPAEQLNAERKQLIRHTIACQGITSKMRARLAEEGEETHALEELEKLPKKQRDALIKALVGKSTTTGSGTVS